MIVFPNFKIINTLYESNKTVIYRAIRNSDNQSVILKLTQPEYPSSEEIANLKREYDILKTIRHYSVISPIDFQSFNKRWCLILEDSNSIPLASAIYNKEFSLKQLIGIALKIVDAISFIHSSDIVHNNINPSNIIINPETSDIQLIDFNNATLPFQSYIVSGSDLDMHYISPEQTGRLKIEVDYRADYYSLGVTLYELFTKQLPHNFQNPMELVHAHIASPPKAPYEIKNAHVPRTISDIIMKLLEKMPDDRYQSSWGIRIDFKDSLRFLEALNEIPTFPIANHDLCEKFRYPSKLYGRNEQIAELASLSDRILQNSSVEVLHSSKHSTSEIFLITGPAGIGKTTLVKKVFHSFPQEKGIFISGSFAMFDNYPYSGFIEAFSELTRRILSESEDEILQWRKKIQDILGMNAGLLKNIIPDLETLIGYCASTEEYPPNEAIHRFNAAFLDFISVFTDSGYVFVLFLDDIQWADIASLHLIEMLFTSKSVRNVYLIGIYHTIETNEPHPLKKTIDTLINSGAVLTHLVLPPFSPDNMIQYLSDQFKCNLIHAEPLAELIMAKTGGIAHSVNIFVKALCDTKLISFNAKTGAWEWDLVTIKTQRSIGSITELMIDKFKHMDKEIQYLLSVASYFGNSFDMQELNIATDMSSEAILEKIRLAIHEGIITENLPYNEKETFRTSQFQRFVFINDDLYKRIYYQFAFSERSKMHYELGHRLLKALQKLDNQNVQEYYYLLFDVVKQFNAGRTHIDNNKDQLLLAGLNLTAGKRARSVSAFDAAYNFFSQGLHLLNEQCWATDYDLIRSLSIHSTEVAYIVGDMDKMEMLANNVLANAKTLKDKIRIYEILIQARIAQNRFADSLGIAKEILSLMGMNILEKPNFFRMIIESVKTRIFIRKSQEGFKNLDLNSFAPPTDTSRILNSVASAIYYAYPDLLPHLIYAGFRLLMKEGLVSWTPFVFAGYGLILCTKNNRIEEGYKFGTLACEMLKKSSKNTIYGRTLQLVYSNIAHWKIHAKVTPEYLLEAQRICIEIGDIEFAMLCAQTRAMNLFFIGYELSALEREMNEIRELMLSYKQKMILNHHCIYHQTVLNLLGKNDDPRILTGEVYNEPQMIPTITNANDKMALFHFYVNKLMLHFLFQDFHEAFQYAELAGSFYFPIRGIIAVPAYFFYDTLARIAVYSYQNKNEKPKYVKRISQNIKKLKTWAKHAPMNYLHKYLLVSAEWNRVFGNDQKASELFDQAIKQAKEQGYLQEESLANELAARFYLAKGRSKVARSYLVDARYCYLQWGATAKVRHIDERYHQLLMDMFQSKSKDSPSIYSELSKLSELLDLSAVVKASLTISGEMVLTNLLHKLMKIVIENAGAQKGFLILKKNDELVIEAHATADEKDKISIECIRVERCNDLSPSIVNYVARTQKMIVVSDAVNEGGFTNDPYVIKSKLRSLLCMPIIRHNELVGIFYLENNLSLGTFTPRRVEMLKLIASQAAISIDNSNLYTKYHSLFQNAVEGIFQTTSDGKIISANPSLATILGYETPKELMDNTSDIKTQVFLCQDDFSKYLKQLHQKNRIVGYETRLYQKGQSIIWVSLSAQIIRDQAGNILYYEGSIMDITDRIESMNALKKAKEEAERANNVKNEFLARMSHEMRTPLHAIMAIAQGLKKIPLADHEKNQLAVLYSSGEKLSQMINDIFEMIEVETGTYQLNNISFDLQSLIKNISVTSAMRNRNNLTCCIEPSTPSRLLGDSIRIRQILLSLLDNAMKFTTDGHILIECGFVGPYYASTSNEKEKADLIVRNMKSTEILFSVHDTGKGIPSDMQERIFEMFIQGDMSTTRCYGGTGLGLSMSKKLVQLMGGQIWVESEPNMGSSFFVKLSLTEDQSSVSEQVPSMSVDSNNISKRILLVEDHPNNQMVFSIYLDDTPHKLDIADNGKIGFEMYTKNKYDIVFMDIEMPVMDGHESTRRIREWEAKNNISPVPIIIVTAHATYEHFQKSKESGCSGFLTKPLEKNSLIKYLKE